MNHHVKQWCQNARWIEYKENMIILSKTEEILFPGLAFSSVAPEVCLGPDSRSI